MSAGDAPTQHRAYAPRSLGCSVLTVSDIDGFADAGGMIQLVREGGRVRFEVNLDSVRGADLTMSSKLLRLASVVHEGASAE